MKLQESIEMLKAEKENKVSSRFPCRVFLLHSVEDYRETVSSLKALCGRAVSSDELFAGADLMPAYDRLLEKLKPDEWVWLPGVGEYLQLFYTSEQRSQRFAKLWHAMVKASNTGRILIPLLNCDSLWNDPALGFQTDERQENFVYAISDHEADPEKRNITVLSSAFEEYFNQLRGKYTPISGLREWYENILNKAEIPSDYCLLTKHAGTVIPKTAEDITIRPIKTTFEFVREHLRDGSELQKDSCTDEMLAELFDESLANASIRDAILHRFNRVTFDGVSIMSNWAGLSEGKRQLLKLWYRLYPDDSYLCRCFGKYEINEIEDHILTDIFDLPQSPAWVEEYRRLLQGMKLEKSDAFFEKLSAIPEYEKRLSFLSGNTRKERVYILRMAGQWFKQDAAQAFASEALRECYPLLRAYLGPLPSELGAVYNEYISDYKAYKLSNTLPESDEAFFRGIEPDALPFRYSILNQYLTNDTIVLWIDGMGFEYLSLLLDRLSNNKAGAVVSCALTQATLPTETEFNDQWLKMQADGTPFDKLDKLDKLAHKGIVDDPDYYSCVEEQLAFFDTVAEKVNELLKDYHRVIITGDHGSSRLAARFFHNREGLKPFKGSEARSHGRYCVITSKPDSVYPGLKEAKDDAGQQYLVFATYDHFSSSGFAAGKDDDNAIFGEVHGGASPEEMIVPVVVFDSKTELPLTVKWAGDKSEVKIKKKAVKAVLEFNKAVKTLKVRAGSIDGAVSDNGDGKTWTVVFEGIKPGEYPITIAADGILVSIDKKLKVISALGGGEGDL